MRTLHRNKRPFWYCLYDRTEKVLDAKDFETGDSRIVYKDAVKCYGNISKTYGEAQVEQFGNSLDYERVIIVEGNTCPIDENTVLFVDGEPKYDSKGNPLYDYVVKRVAPSLASGISYAIKRVR